MHKRSRRPGETAGDAGVGSDPQRVVTERNQLEQAIMALDAQRAVLGDAVVDAAIAPLRGRLAAIEAQLVVEQRKQVTVLFADTSGFTAAAETMDPEDVRDIMQAYFARLAALITRHGGVVEKFIGDAIMAVFGVPAALESDPENAVRAALGMQQHLGQLNEELERARGLRLAMRIGINTGPVVVSFLGGGTGEDFAVVGDTVNVASRLERAAPAGAILISQNTYRHVRGVFNVLPQAPLTVKGKREPLQVYIVQGANPRAFRLPGRGVQGTETRMIGREAELAHLQAALQSVVEQREAYVVTILGDAGVGKSRLLDEFLSWLYLIPQAIWLFRGRAGQESGNLPYALIRDLLAFRFEIHDSDRAAVARQKLERGVTEFLGPEAIEKAPFIGHLIGLDFSANAQLQGLLTDARQVRDRAFQYLTELFTAIARDDTTAIFLEDIHAADEGSLEVIEHLGRACRNVPLLIICLTRRSLLERRPSWGAGHIHHTRLELGPLTEQQSRRLVGEVLHRAARIPPALRDLVVSRAEGNPFYLEELINMLIEDGVIATEGELWEVRVERLAEVRVPPTLTGVIQARLDALAPLERDVLQRAAVVGRVFWDELVAWLGAEPPAANSELHGAISAAPDLSRALAALDPKLLAADLPLHDPRATVNLQPLSKPQRGIEPILRALQDKGLIVRRDVPTFAGAHEYLFKNAILHEVTYERVLRRVRRIYHAQVAAWLIERSGERVSEYAGLIGEHYERASRPAQAAEWYGWAAKQAQDTYAPDVAAGYYHKALALLPASDDLAQTMRRSAVYEGLGEMLLRQARYAEAAEGYAAMRSAAEAARDVLSQARAWYGLAEVHENLGNYRAALECALQVEDIARAAGGQIELVMALLMRGWCLFQLGDAPGALALSEQALLLSTEIDDQYELARSLNLIGTIYRAQGRYEQAAAYMQNALALHRELDDLLRVAGTLNNLGLLAVAQGNYALAVAHYEEALTTARTIDDRRAEQVFQANLASALWEWAARAPAQAPLLRQRAQVLFDQLGVAAPEVEPQRRRDAE